ncbi:subunit C of exonuclease SbcCD [Paenibacillus sp. 32O-W]|uniref:AAA family ATPase n=2 Tax=Paenibacillus TaxID=44249 RepID=UPI00071FAB34|nr:SMC family ATPase [Paenibacillus sp. 32O-W]ALS27288.1 subunit C of exonuclease SbcCD [Paenibacillus sp. 32O-W]
MKPIRLKLAGLQSYREAQEIDFERLCEGGVFGIFGPTGSGKSSILDAMTLALYGKVERAAGGTQGIMNQAEKTLFVAFTFELNGGGRTRRFRVERQFKRSGDVSVGSALCRFIELLPQGEQVLADKLADVNRCVEEHIGLNMQDFTRAVVLPQGKFAEFLSLTGKERRSMLQRLFRLERYGDGLAARLQQRVRAAESALAEAAAEQQGLGDASAEAVAAAEARCREAAREAEQARRALAEAERVYAEQQEVRARQEALRAKEALQAKLLEDAPKVEALEAELRRLAAAERLMPALDARDAAEAQLRALAARREEAGRTHAARQEAAAAAAAAWTAASAAAAEAEPRLALRLDQLAQALRLEEEAAKLARAIEDGERRHADAVERQRRYGEQAAQTNEKLARGTARQSELKAALQAVELKPHERQQRLLLSRRLQERQTLAAQLSAAREELAAQEKAAAEAADNCRQAEAALERERRELAAAEREVSPVAAALGELEDGLRRLAAAAETALQRERQRERELERGRLAAQLAAELADGAPCPVCGSCSHPALHGQSAPNAQPAATAGAADAAAAIEGGAAAWERLLRRMQEALLALAPVRHRADEWLAKLREAADGLHGEPLRSADDAAGRAVRDLLGAWPAEAAAAVAATPQAPGAMPEFAGAPGLAEASAALEAAEERRRTCELQLGRFGQQLTAALKRLNEARSRAETAAAELRALERPLAAVRRRAEEAQAAMAADDGRWAAEFPGLPPEKAEETLADWERRDKETDDLKERLERSVTFLEEHRQLLAELQEAERQAQLEAVQAAAALEGDRRLAADQRERLAAWTGGRPAAELIAAAERELKSLRERLQAAQREHEAAQAALQQSAERRAAAEEAEQTAAERLAAASAHWDELLAGSEFESAEAVASLRGLLPQKEAMEAAIARHREAEKQLAAQVELLREQLGGRSVTDEEWSACVEAWTAAKRASEEKLQAEARAQRDRDELAGKHERWTELEEKRRGLQELQGRLAKLQSVFRGNAFVEYIAEEQLVQVCRVASERLGYLTKRRYALEVDSGGGFVIRDDANGGIRRPVSTLSGGETFLASLSLALALSAQIQLRGRHPLQFFFLDEGFGTLDPELLETVIAALEKLHTSELAVGVISHVPELRARLPRRLIVTPAEPSGAGSRVAIETM